MARLAVKMRFFLGRKTFGLKTKDLKWFCGVPLAIYNWGLLLGIGLAAPIEGKLPGDNFNLLASLIQE